MDRVIRKTLTVMLALSVALSFGLGVGASPAYAKSKTVKAKSVSLNYKAYTLRKGKSIKLKAKVLPANSTQKKIVWKSSNTKVATVKNGKVTALGKKGKAVITATVKGTKKKAKATIYIGTPVKKVSFAVSEISLTTGESVTVKATISPKKSTVKGITYTSSDKSIAVVDPSGKISAVAAGKAVITASPKDGAGKSAELTVTVTDPMEDTVTNPMKVAVITDGGNVEDSSFNEITYKAARAFCGANGLAVDYRIPKGDGGFPEDTDIIRTVDNAVAEGFNVILMPGFTFSEVLYQAAPKHPDVKFIALDLSREDIAQGRSFSADNVYCATYREEVAGYMAGYAAVKMGYKKLGFLGGMDIPAVRRYGYGFVQGADAAAKDGGISGVEVKYVYGGQFFGDDTVTTAMDAWYGSGTECVFACGGMIYTSAAEAARKANGKVIGVDLDQSGIIDKDFGTGMTVTSAVKGLEPTINTVLGAIINGQWDNYKGRSDLLGIVSDTPELNYVQLPETTQWSSSFTKADYADLVKELNSGSKTVKDETNEMPAVSNISIDDQGAITH